MEILLYIFGIVLGWTARGIYARKRLDMLMKDAEDQSEPEHDAPIPIIIEKHNDIFYVYGMKDKTFMAQGDTRWHLEKNLEKRYPGKKFGASQENLKEIGFVNDTNN
jgi:hypothetical protein